MLKVVAPDEMRQIDANTIRQFGIPGIVLMENAAIGVAGAVEKRLDQMHKKNNCVIIFCGKGNNGGDGFSAARHLYCHHVTPLVCVIGSRAGIKGDALINLEILEKLPVEIFFLDTQDKWEKCKNRLLEGDIVVDAIFGTGLSRNIDGLAADIIEWINQGSFPVLSVDIPSGVDGNNGKILGQGVVADETITFAFPKIGHFLYPGREYTGKLLVQDISIPLEAANRIHRDVLEDKDMQRYLSRRKANTHKGSYGKVCVIGGSKGLVGAAAMTAEAALRTGSGLVTLGVPESLINVYQGKMTEIMTFPLPDDDGNLALRSLNTIGELLKDKDCLAIGTGIGKKFEIFEILRNIIEDYDIPIVIDADGINHICQDIRILRKAKGNLIITPHPGEMARLINGTIRDVIDAPLETAMDFAAEWGVTVVLKGSTTIIAEPAGKVTFNTTGNPGMATGGSGDILTGIIAGLLGMGISPYEAARAGCYIHGRAGDHAALTKGEYGMIAGDIIYSLPLVIKSFVGR